MRWDALGVILGIIGITFAAGVWVQQKDSDTSDVQDKLKKLEEKILEIGKAGKIPSGTVIAFDSIKCPNEEWSYFSKASGRFLLGAGKGSNLTSRNIGDTGGEEANILSLDEMPAHTHSAKHAEWGQFNWKGGGNDPHWNKTKTFTNYETGSAGNNKAHNNMPPFLTLTFCIKK